MGFCGQVEVEARARLDFAHERIRIDLHGTRPVVGGRIATNHVPRNPFNRSRIAPEFRWIVSCHQLVLLLRHLKDAAVKRFRERHADFAIRRQELPWLNAAKDELRGLVLVRVEAALRFGGEVRYGILARVRSRREIDDAVEDFGWRTVARRGGNVCGAPRPDRAFRVHAEAETTTTVAVVKARRDADASVGRGATVRVVPPTAAAIYPALPRGST